jgi:hypothetical protein
MEKKSLLQINQSRVGEPINYQGKWTPEIFNRYPRHEVEELKSYEYPIEKEKISKVFIDGKRKMPESVKTLRKNYKPTTFHGHFNQ